jgi:hypothetical protein
LTESFLVRPGWLHSLKTGKESQVLLPCMDFRFGLGIEMNSAESKQLFHKASKIANVTTKLQITESLLDFDSDLSTARLFYEMTADSGSSEVQYSLSKFYPPGTFESRFYLEDEKAIGSPRAVDHSNKSTGRNRD